MDIERQKLINEAARIVNNIEQMVIDAEYWNETHPDEEPIIPDPDGRMATYRTGLAAMLAAEAAKGNHPSVVPNKASRRRYIPKHPEPRDLALD